MAAQSRRPAAGNEQAPDSLEHRERWGTGQGQLTVRDTAAGITDIAAVRDRAHPVRLNPQDTGLLCVALVEDLAQLAARSPLARGRTRPGRTAGRPSLRTLLNPQTPQRTPGARVIRDPATPPIR